MKTNTVTLWHFDFCDSGIGIWSRDWFATEAEAKKAHQEKIDAGYDPEGNCGEEGDLLPVHSTEIALTPEGLLSFANNESDPNYF